MGLLSLRSERSEQLEWSEGQTCAQVRVMLISVLQFRGYVGNCPVSHVVMMRKNVMLG